MKSLTFFSLLNLATVVLPLQAQTIHRCATHEVYENNTRKYPAYATAVNNAFDYAKNYAIRSTANKASEIWVALLRTTTTVLNTTVNAPSPPSRMTSTPRY